MIVSCAAGQGGEFERDLAGLGAEIVIAEERERLGRGGGIKFAAQLRPESGDVYALNGDELVDVDFAALLARHREAGGLATLTVAQPQVAVRPRRASTTPTWCTASARTPAFPYWVNCGNYVLTDEAIERFPERGDHESTTFPELASEGRLHAHRHAGPLADGEHAEGATRRDRARRGASGVACMSTSADRTDVRTSPEMSPTRRTSTRWMPGLTK